MNTTFLSLTVLFDRWSGSPSRIRPIARSIAWIPGATRLGLGSSWLALPVLCLGLLLGTVGCHPLGGGGQASSLGARFPGVKDKVRGRAERPRLVERVLLRLQAARALPDAERVVLGERLRGEEGRARLVLEALLAHPEATYRNDVLGRLADIPRPDRAPLIDQQLGLEPHPPRLMSSAAPRALGRVAGALAGEGLLPELLLAAQRYLRAGDFIESAGIMTLAQRVLELEGTTEPMRSEVRKLWEDLARRRRCVAQVYDAAQGRSRLLNKLQPKDVPPVTMVERTIAADPSRLSCAALALQLAGSQPAMGAHATWAARALLAPILITSQYASLDLLSAQRQAVGPVVRGEPQRLREALRTGIARYLKDQPQEAWRLLPLIGQDPGGTLSRERLDDVVLRLLFAAPPVPDAAEKLRWAFRRHYAVVAGDPLGYVAYMSRLGPAFCDALILALREPDPEVLAQVAAALADYPTETVEHALAQPLETPRGGFGGGHERLNRQVLRHLFRLPGAAETAAEETSARRLSLDLHRCCRGDRGSCDRLAVSEVRRCPAWTPLRWW